MATLKVRKGAFDALTKGSRALKKVKLSPPRGRPPKNSMKSASESQVHRAIQATKFLCFIVVLSYLRAIYVMRPIVVFLGLPLFWLFWDFGAQIHHEKTSKMGLLLQGMCLLDAKHTIQIGQMVPFARRYTGGGGSEFGDDILLGS